MQDAGLIPVDIHQQMSGLAGGNPNVGSPGRPRGISATIPQEAIDEMMREHPLDNSNPPQNENDVIQPRS